MGKSRRGYPLRKAPLEKHFQDKVMRELRKIPKSWWFKINDRATVGIPDILGAVNGYSVLIELKTKEKLTPIQLYHLERADQACSQSFVATPGNWAEVLHFIQGLSQLQPPPVAQLRKPARIPLWCMPSVPRWS